MLNKDDFYQITISSDANDKMYEHFEFLARVSYTAATRLLEKLIKDIRSLNVKPYRHPTFNRPYLPIGKYRYMMSSKRYRIIYQIVVDNVYIDDIQDCRQNDDKSKLTK